MRSLLKYILILLPLAGAAQSSRQITDRTLLWTAVNAQFKLNKAFVASLDGQVRYDLGREEWFQWLIRPGITYNSSYGWQYTAGIAYFHLYPSPNGKPPRPELRPWGEIGFRKKATRSSWNVRSRVEQRFIREYAGAELSDHFSTGAFRLRFRFDYQWYLKPSDEKGWFLTAGDEIFFLRNKDGFSAFDQNRIWSGPGYKFSSLTSLQLHYMNLFMQKNSTHYEQDHIIRLMLQLNFDLSKKNEQP